MSWYDPRDWYVGKRKGDEGVDLGAALMPGGKTGLEPIVRSNRAGVAREQAKADALPDEFDLLLREAMFAETDDEESARKRTFTTTPRGIQGPFKSVLG